ncbi:methionine--tRNA ligase [Acidocella aromatica]|uniref:Methionine--tRNA ligase n=1 Tax=Acidocella aromatica TaxID=1303579 RepID=A0A840VLP4_9PROT|nr:methionine--tRNA ligase [Acidocella aromatica]MBB5372390.1 methionyl-tRNA synthetase [Acidocella aromatica]
MNKQSFYITTPIYYVNGSPHLGHAYTSTAADALARWNRLEGHDVFFLTGTDEHGQKVEAAARAAGIEPQEFADRVSADFQDMARVMNISNDDFIRTTEARHKRSAQALWTKLRESGAIYLGKYEGWYAVRDEAFYDEEETSVKPDGTRVAIASGAEVKWVVEPSYFFKLSAFQDKLLAFYEENPGFIAPQAKRNEILSFVRSGLRDLSVSRTSFSWGIPVPGDEQHVMYVWLDALQNYLTACGYPEMDGERAHYWPASLHLVGKEIIRFHAVYWPAFLMAAGMPLPRRVFSHGWWTVEGEKMSKSLGNFIDVRPLVEEFGLDQVRYFLLREVPFGNDGDFSRKALIGRINSDLANGIGNLAQRTLSFINKNAGAAVPPRGALHEADDVLLALAAELPEQIRAAMDRLAFNEALDATWRVIRAADAYIDHQAPWTLRKSDTDRMNTVLYTLASVLRSVGVVLQPFMPETMGKLLDYLGVGEDRSLTILEARLAEGTALPAPSGLFPRVVEAA